MERKDQPIDMSKFPCWPNRPLSLLPDEVDGEKSPESHFTGSNLSELPLPDSFDPPHHPSAFEADVQREIGRARRLKEEM